MPNIFSWLITTTNSLVVLMAINANSFSSFFFRTVGLVMCQELVESGMDSLVVESAPMLADSWIPQSLDADDETNVTVAMAVHPSLRRRRRDIFHLYNMMTCATNCDPLSYKGYGCYCGFLGSGAYVDGIDRFVSSSKRLHYATSPIIICLFKHWPALICVLGVARFTITVTAPRRANTST